MNIRRAVGALTPLLALAALAACGGSTGSAASDGPVDYRSEDLRTGEPVDLAGLRGDVVLLTGWATWCAPCREELPALAALAEERAADGLSVVSVNLDPEGPSKRNALPTLDQLAPTLPAWVDTDGEFSVVFSVVAMPTNVLVGRDGRILHTWDGAIDLDDPTNLKIIDEALARPPTG